MTPSILSDLLSFLGESPTPFHAVAAAVERLVAKGFSPLDEKSSWDGLTAGRYFVVHEGSALIAFIVPDSHEVAGFRIVGAHTDSPNLRLKPKAEYAKEGYEQLGVEIYGGVLLNSWLDRDLALAGRVLVRDENGKVVSRLVRIDKPLLRVPQLAIHLDRDVNDKGLHLNKQEHLAPVFGLTSSRTAESRDANTAAEGGLTELLTAELKVDAAAILGRDLMLYDVVPPTRGGRSGEFIFSGRLDNLAMSHAATTALASVTEASSPAPGAIGGTIPVIALFDHEEVGSQTESGAASPFLPRVLERILLGLGQSRDDLHRILADSLCVSADMAHAVHPNYVDRHEPRHRPVINGGPVIKTNAQQRYATNGRTAAIFAALCQEAGVPVQQFVNRTDLPCGSTIGPITATLLGIPTVDVGNPLLSMHSIREMGGADDPEYMVRALIPFLSGH